MSHWAEIDNNNIVLRVLVCSNDEPDEGYSWLVEQLGGRWLKTSYNTRGGIHLFGDTPLRKNYAGIGYTYDEILDAFIPPKPEQFPSFIVNPDTGLWEPPIPKPEGDYYWDESGVAWVPTQDPAGPPKNSTIGEENV